MKEIKCNRVGDYEISIIKTRKTFTNFIQDLEENIQRILKRNTSRSLSSLTSKR